MFGPLPIRIMAGIAFIVARLPKLENISVNQGFFGSLGLPPELVLPIAILEVIGGVFLIVGVLTRITAAIFVIEMIGATLVVWLSQGFVWETLLKQAAILTSSLLMPISISLLLTGPGRISIERDVLKREVFPKEKYITQDYKDAPIWDVYLKRPFKAVDYRLSIYSYIRPKSVSKLSIFAPSESKEPWYLSVISIGNVTTEILGKIMTGQLNATTFRDSA